MASVVWERFGNIQQYVEPFFGSGAVLLARPGFHDGVHWTETVNDKDGYIANVWRAIAAAPDVVAEWADWPANENDLHARHSWLLAQKDALHSRLEANQDYYDAKIAGWWLWGIALWIGSGWCAGGGPWQPVNVGTEEEPDWQLLAVPNSGQGVNRQLLHLSDTGRGVNRKLLHLSTGLGVNRKLLHLSTGLGVNRKRLHLSNTGRGVNRQRLHLSNSGQGVNRQRLHLSNSGQGVNRQQQNLQEWMQALSQRLRHVRVCSGDWSRILTDGAMMNVPYPTAVFLDPPYSAEATRRDGLYAIDDLGIAHEVRAWCLANTDRPLLRIALCGYAGEGHEELETRGWTRHEWSAAGGMSNTAAVPSMNRHREVIWFSPYCLPPRQQRLF